jgi:hypothetical protein
MNIASNPWSFTNADVASSTAAASPGGMIQQGAPAFAAVLYTATGAHNLSVGQHVTYISDTNGRFLGHYVVIAVPSATTALLANLSSPSSGSGFNSVIAASGGGTMLVCQYPQMIRAEDISIQNNGTAPGSVEVLILDKNGSPVWIAAVGTAAPGSDVAQNRGKPLWINGLTLQLVPTNITILVTVN